MLVNLADYSLNALRTDDEFVLYRGFGGPEPPSILALVPTSSGPLSLERLECEYRLRQELDAEWAVRPIALVRDEGQTKLIFQDPGGHPLSTIVGTPLDLGRFLRLSVHITAALGKLHERGLIHKDIKPSNILVEWPTETCRLTGFGLATRASQIDSKADARGTITGTLAYMSPEQTGRLNRSLDTRTDLYSLGVTFYELLTGELPFQGADALEWVHAHLAKQPQSPAERIREIPTAVSAIVLKLLAKAPEERYQTANSVEADLWRCLQQHASGVPIQPFSLGDQDLSSRLLTPRKLYGRDDGRRVLLDAFEHVRSAEKPELVLVSGSSGVGKSTLVNNLGKLASPGQSLFAGVKFDQSNRNIPYTTLAQAFEVLVHELLAKPELEVEGWRDTISTALGQNGQLMVHLIPELEYLIGPQPAVADLPPKDAQNRFQTLFRRFIAVFGRPDRPLVLFLDDIQWLDAATLEFVEHLLTDPDVHHLLVIGAYRDNEVDSIDPVRRTAAAVRSAETTVRELKLTLLTRDEIIHWLADVLRCDFERIEPLAVQVHELTSGNPFFVIHFITELVDEKLLTFDRSGSGWTWDLDSIRTKGYIGDVADFLFGKLNRLSASTQEVLQELASFGGGVQASSLALVRAEQIAATEEALRELVRAGLVVQTETTYQCRHDRVQEAAYALIPEQRRAATHLRIGRLLALHAEPGERDERIFETVNQLNRGISLVETTEEKEQIAELNLKASRRAKAAADYPSALAYLEIGRSLVSPDAWDRQPRLMFSLELQSAECEFLTGQFSRADNRLSTLTERVCDLSERATVIFLQIGLYRALEQSDRGVAVGLEFLREFGIDWSPHPTLAEVAAEYDRIEESLGSRSIESLIDLPEMEDPIQRTIVDLLAALEEPAFFTDENLRCLMVARMINISLAHGNTDGSCIAYVHLGWFLAPRFGDFEAGFRFGKLGLDLVERPGLQRFRARVLQCFGYFINPCSAHLRAGIPLLRRSFGLAQEAGDLTYAGYCCDRLVTLLLAAGESLEDIQRAAEDGLAFLGKLGFHHLTGILVGQLRFVQCLRSSQLDEFSFDDADFNERSFEQTLQEDPHLVFVRSWYWIRKLQALFYDGDYEAAAAAVAKVEPLMQVAPSFFEAFEIHFYAALARAAIIDQPSTPEAIASYELISAHLEQLQTWAAKSPENFADRAALVAAELARLNGRTAEAMELYEQAIRLAHSNGFLPNEGLAYELAARFYVDHGFERFARLYLAEARHCYSRWGARRKVEHLDTVYPNLRQTQAPVSSGAVISASLAELDLSAVLRVSQAVSGEIVLDSLIQSLLRIVVEHAGAQRGLLILFDENVPRIEAEAAVVQNSVVVHLHPTTTSSSALPESVLHYVIRTHKNVILDDAAVGNLFSEDLYIRRTQPRSIFCLPLLKQSRLVGVLYLENNLAVGVFTPSRQGMLELLASQAAISLENARLYFDLARLNDALRSSEQLLQGIVDNTSAIIFVKDLDLRYVLVNREYERRYQVQRDQVRGKTDFDLFSPEIAEVLRMNDRQVIEEGKTIESEDALPGEKGVNYYFSVKFLLRSATGHPYAVCGIATDITERRRAEEAVREAQSALAHITRVLTIGELTASIAHELNQPLTGIVTNGNACLRWLGTSPPNLNEARQAVSRIVRDGRRAADVITRIRALVRKTKTEMVPLNLNDALQEVVLLAQAELRKNNVRLLSNLEGTASHVVGDRVQLQQVMLNLVVNAIEAVAGLEDPERRTVWISSHEHDSDQILFSIRDTGVGLPPESLETIFGAFVTTKPQGMGMGLAISRSIIENHGGRLWAENNLDHGVTFFFTLPKGPPSWEV